MFRSPRGAERPGGDSGMIATITKGMRTMRSSGLFFVVYCLSVISLLVLCIVCFLFSFCLFGPRGLFLGVRPDPVQYIVYYSIVFHSILTYTIVYYGLIVYWGPRGFVLARARKEASPTRERPFKLGTCNPDPVRPLRKDVPNRNPLASYVSFALRGRVLDGARARYYYYYYCYCYCYYYYYYYCYYKSKSWS